MEPGDDHLRARITQTLDINDPVTDSMLVWGRERVSQVLADFLQAFVEQDGVVTRW